MNLTVSDIVLIIGFSLGLFIGIVYTKVKYGLPFFMF